MEATRTMPANGTEQIAQNAAVQVAKEKRVEADGDGIITLNGGHRVRLLNVPDVLIQRAMSKIEDPPVPMWHNEQKGRDEPNPSDPDYQRAVNEANEARGWASIDTTILFGVELVDGVPDEDRWVRKLSILDIDFDADDEVEREFAYLKYIVFASSENMNVLMRQLGMSSEGVEEAMNSFPGDEARPADSESADEGGR